MLAISSIFVIMLVSTTAVLLINSQHNLLEDETLNFYVFGDSQGYQGAIEEIAALANIYHPDFVVHCGDLTSFGQEDQYVTVSQALDVFEVPVYVTPGNHDIRLGGGARYTASFGPARYSYDIGPAHFTVFNTSANDVAETELAWLEGDLSNTEAEYKFVFTHTPPFDPRAGHEHSMRNMTAAARLMELFERFQVNTVFAGHIHIFNTTVHNEVRYVITGGAGASLYADSENGGFHHFVNVTLNSSGLTIEAVPIQTPALGRDVIAIRSIDEDVTLSLSDLHLLDTIEGDSSFENKHGNWNDIAKYTGVKVAELVELVGGMDSEDILRVISNDGFVQEFHYSNVYPNGSWFSRQGHMIIAFSYNDEFVPEWSDGMRLVMLPEDQGYSNDDCRSTSAPGMGYNVYPSAGARWVRFVSFVEVIKG
jgi:predicted phosphodiesterase